MERDESAAVLEMGDPLNDEPFPSFAPKREKGPRDERVSHAGSV
jgi:hypothetical protein